MAFEPVSYTTPELFEHPQDLLFQTANLGGADVAEKVSLPLYIQVFLVLVSLLMFGDSIQLTNLRKHSIFIYYKWFHCQVSKLTWLTKRSKTHQSCVYLYYIYIHIYRNVQVSARYKGNPALSSIVLAHSISWNWILMKLLNARQERSEEQNQWAVPLTLQLHKISEKLFSQCRKYSSFFHKGVICSVRPSSLQRWCIQLIQKSCFSSVKPLDVQPIQVNRQWNALKHSYLPRPDSELNQSIYWKALHLHRYMTVILFPWQSSGKASSFVGYWNNLNLLDTTFWVCRSFKTSRSYVSKNCFPSFP